MKAITMITRAKFSLAIMSMNDVKNKEENYYNTDHINCG